MQSATQSQDVIRPFFEVLENRLLLANTIVDFFPMPPGETWTYQANVDGSTSTVTTTVSPTPVGVGGIACKELRNSVSGSYVSSEFMNLTTTGLYLKQLVTIEPSWLVNGTGTTVVTEIFAGNGQVQAFNALTVPGGFSANGNLTGSTSEGINWTGSWNESTTTSWEAVTVTAGAFNAYKIVYTGSETRFGTYINNSWREEIGWTKTLWLAEGWGIVKSAEVLDDTFYQSVAPTNSWTTTSTYALQSYTAPVLAIGTNAAALAYAENAPAVAIDAALTITTSPKVPYLTSATVQIGSYVQGQDVLTFTNVGTVTGSFNASTGVLTFTGTATSGIYQSALRAVKYQNTSDNPSTAARRMTFTVTDGTETATASRQVNVAAVNDPPTLTGPVTLPGGIEDTPLPINFAALLAAANAHDVDSPTITFRVDAISSGTLRQGTTAVAAGAFITSTQSLTWTPAANANGALNAFTVKAWDGTSLSATAIQVKVDVAAVNDAPTVATLTANPAVTQEGMPLTLTVGGVADVDGPVAKVAYYQDADGNGLFDSAVDLLLGEKTAAAGDWSWIIPASALPQPPGTLWFFAQPSDDQGLAGAGKGVKVLLNAAPTVGGVAASGAVYRGKNVTLTATNVADISGTIAKVEFFRDVDGDGVIETTDKLLGLGIRQGTTNTWNLTTATTGWAMGDNHLIARATDNQVGTGLAFGLAVVQNNPPVIGTLTTSAAVANAGTPVKFTAGGLTDSDGTTAKVEFYLDNGDGVFNASTDTDLGAGTFTAATWQFTHVVTSLPGAHWFFAQATDNDGTGSAAKSVLVTVNAPPTVGGVAASGTVYRGKSVTLTATGVSDAGPPVGTIAKVEFFRDVDGDGLIETTDKFLGLGVRQGTTNTWNLATPTTGWAMGVNGLILRVTDNNGGTAQAVGQASVEDCPPVIGTLTTSAAVVNQGTSAKFTAGAVTDSDGTISKVEFYADNGDGAFNAATDTDLGAGTFTAATWQFTQVVTAAPGAHVFFAQATDNDAVTSAAKAVTVTVNAAPMVGGVAASGAVYRGKSVTLTATNVTDVGPPVGTIAKVEFFRDVDGDGLIESTDKLLGLGVRQGTTNTWNLATPTTGWAMGDNNLIARVTDNNGGTGLATGLASVEDCPPVIGTLTAAAAVANAGAADKLTVGAVTDSDGKVASVAFYADDGDGVFDPTKDALIGQGGYAVAVWTFMQVVPMAAPPGTQWYFAQATDNDGVVSAPKGVLVTVNAPPTVAGVAASGTVYRGKSVTLTATGVSDAGPPAGTIAKVEFFRDVDQDGLIETTDKLLGLGVRQGTTSTWNLSTPTTGWAMGVNGLIVRVTDNNGGTAQATGQAIVQNNPPVIGTLTSSVPVVNAGTPVKFTAGGLTDSDGTTAKVEFYLDNGDGVFNASTDTDLGAGTFTAATWQFTHVVTSLPGAHWFFAQATDNDGTGSAAKSVLVTVNAPPVVGGVAASGTVYRGKSVTLTATGVSDVGPPAGTIAKVEFFRDVDQDGLIETTDKLLGVGVRQGTTSTWNLSTPTTGWAMGVNGLIVRVTDNNGGTAQAVGQASVEDCPPVIGTLTTSAAVVNQGTSAKFTAGAVTDSDGTTAKVEFYADNGDGAFDAATDTDLGAGTFTAATWQFTQIVTAAPGAHVFFAQATDNDGVTSAAKAVTVTVNAAPMVGGVAASGAVYRGKSVTLTATNVTDVGPPAGTIAKVEFFRDVDGDGLIESTDKLLGLGVRQGTTNTWNLTTPTTGWAMGDNNLIARATDNNGGTGQATGLAVVQNNAPVVGTLTPSATTLTAGLTATLTAGGVTDSDGTVAKVEFFSDDGDGVFDATKDEKIGEDISATGGWTFTDTVVGTDEPAKTWLFARATDNDGTVGAAKGVQVTLMSADVLYLLGFDQPGASKHYAGTLTATGGLSMTGTVTTTVAGGSGAWTRGVAYTVLTSNSQDFNQMGPWQSGWERQADGEYIDQVPIYMLGDPTQITIAPLKFSPLFLSGTFKSAAAPVTIDLGAGGLLTGTVTVTTTLNGTQQVTVGAQSYNAAKVTMEVKWALSGWMLDDAGTKVTGTATETDTTVYYATSDAGVVRQTSTSVLSASTSTGPQYNNTQETWNLTA